MNERLLIGTRKGLFTYSLAGGDAKPVRRDFLGDPVSMVLSDERDGTLYAALDLGHFGSKLRRSSDGGESWEEVATPTYPEQPPTPKGEHEDVPWKLKQVWSLEPGGADEPGRLWLGTIPGGLFVSDDRGGSWELVRGLWDHPDRRQWFGGGADQPGLHSICVDPRNSRHVTVGVSCGGAWVTRDGGESWECRAAGMFADYMPPDRREDPVIQDPHRIVHCRAEPDVLWCQHHNAMFRSTDAGGLWQHLQDVSPSDFGFAVACHPTDPETAWFVPAVSDECRVPVDGRLVVNRTRDGGRSFETLGDGLPREDAYDLVFRHALDVGARGEQLAFGSTTGSLWLSRDQGERWVALSLHLPPIYCVRFA